MQVLTTSLVMHTTCTRGVAYGIVFMTRYLVMQGACTTAHLHLYPCMQEGQKAAAAGRPLEQAAGGERRRRRVTETGERGAEA